MTPKKLQQHIEKEIKNALKSFIGHQISNRSSSDMSEVAQSILQKFVPNSIDPGTVTVEDTGNGRYLVKTNLRADMFPSLYRSTMTIIGSKIGEVVHWRAMTLPLSDVIKYITDSESLNDADLFFQSLDVSTCSIDEFNNKIMTFGGALLFDSTEWFVQNNNMYDRESMIKLSSYLNFQ